MSWRESLIRISTYEVEVLQKRLSEVVERRWAVEIRLAALEAEVEAEVARSRADAEANFYLVGFRQGARIRRERLNAELAGIEAEEAGARDALAEAFEAQKKFEQVAESARLAEAHEAARRETAELDEMGLRLSARR